MSSLVAHTTCAPRRECQANKRARWEAVSARCDRFIHPAYPITTSHCSYASVPAAARDTSAITQLVLNPPKLPRHLQLANEAESDSLTPARPPRAAQRAHSRLPTPCPTLIPPIFFASSYTVSTSPTTTCRARESARLPYWNHNILILRSTPWWTTRIE